MFLEAMFAPGSKAREEADELLNRAANFTCGEVIEDRAVSDERLAEYRVENAVSALDGYVAEELSARGLLHSKKDGPTTHWGPLSELMRRPTFENYSQMIASQGFGFTDAATRGSSEERVMAALRDAVEQLERKNVRRKLTLGTDIHRHFRYRSRATGIEPLSNDADVELIVGGQYPYRVGDLISGAAASISLAMFICSYGDENHPARQLVEKLIAAHQRGVQVQVLFDQDRRADVYDTRIINRPAAVALEEAGVKVRFDETTELTHSKVLVIDQKLTVIGSHNWSRSSFFEYDEVSVLITDEAVATDYHRDLTRRIERGLAIPEPDQWIVTW